MKKRNQDLCGWTRNPVGAERSDRAWLKRVSAVQVLFFGWMAENEESSSVFRWIWV